MPDSPSVVLETDGEVDTAEADFAAPAQANIDLAAGRVAAKKETSW